MSGEAVAEGRPRSAQHMFAVLLVSPGCRLASETISIGRGSGYLDPESLSSRVGEVHLAPGWFKTATLVLILGEVWQVTGPGGDGRAQAGSLRMCSLPRPALAGVSACSLCGPAGL